MPIRKEEMLINKKRVDKRLSTKTRQLSKNIDIITLFLDNYSKSLNGREIARMLSLSPQAALNKINQLMESNILNYIKKGNNNLYSLSINDTTKQILIMAESLNSINIITQNKELGVIIPELIKNCEAIILFGSFSSGLYDNKSDVDLVLIGKCRKNEIEKIKKRHIRTVNTEFVSWKQLEDAFKNKKPLTKEILINHRIFGNVSGVVDIFWRHYFGR